MQMHWNARGTSEDAERAREQGLVMAFLALKAVKPRSGRMPLHYFNMHCASMSELQGCQLSLLIEVYFQVNDIAGQANS